MIAAFQLTDEALDAIADAVAARLAARRAAPGMADSLTISEAASRIGCSVSSLYRRMEAGEIRPINEIGRRKLSRETVESLMNHQQEGNGE